MLSTKQLFLTLHSHPQFVPQRDLFLVHQNILYLRGCKTNEIEGCVYVLELAVNRSVLTSDKGWSSSFGIRPGS
jgi:hypothetical protein